MPGTSTSAAVQTTYTLDGQGEATAIADGLSDTTKYQYDADHDVTQITDANTNVITNTYLLVGPNNGSGIGSTGLISQTTSPVVGLDNLPGQSPTNVNILTTYTYSGTDPLEVTRVTTPTNTIGDTDTQYTYDAHHGLLTTAELLGTTNSGSGCPNVAAGPSAQLPAAVQLTVAPSSNCTTTYYWRGRLNYYNSFGQLDYTVDGRGLLYGQAKQANVRINTAQSLVNPNYQVYQLYQRT